jgi:hypothetical protein
MFSGLKRLVARVGTNSSRAARALRVTRRRTSQTAKNTRTLSTQMVTVYATTVFPNTRSERAIPYGNSEAYCA